MPRPIFRLTIYQIFLASTFFLNSQQVQAQNEFKNGFIVTAQKDTLNGYIGFREGSSMYRICEFKEDLSQPAKSYLPNDILAYSVSDLMFVSETHEDDKSQKVFFQLILAGKVSLLRYENDLILRKEGRFYPLTSKESKQYSGDQEYLVKDTRYIGVIKYLLVECTANLNNYETLKLSETGLIKALKSYYQCINEPFTIYQSEDDDLSFKFGLETGIAITQMFVNYNNFDAAYIIDGSKSLKPTFGVNVYIALPKSNERLSFLTGLHYLPVSLNYQWERQEAFALFRSTVDINLQQLKIPVGVKYKYTGWKIMPFVKLAATLTTPLKTEYSRLVERESGGNVFSDIYENQEFSKLQMGIIAAIGADLSLSEKTVIHLNAKYELTSAIFKTSWELITAEFENSGLYSFYFTCGIDF